MLPIEVDGEGARTPLLEDTDAGAVAFGGTVTKSLAPGLRLGWMAVPETLVDVVRLRYMEDRHLPVTEQIAFARLLSSGDFERHIRRMRNRYRNRRERLLTMLAERVPEARPLGILAGLRVLLELPPSSAAAEELARAGGEGVDNSLFPVGPCYHTGHAPEGHDALVLGYAALAEHEFDQGLDTLGTILARQPGPG